MARKEILAIYISKPPLLKTKEGFRNNAYTCCIGVLSCTFVFHLPVVLTQEGSRNDAYISKSVLAYFPVPSVSTSLSS